LLLSAWPLPEPEDWVDLVPEPQTDAETEAIRRSVQRGQPYGSPPWVLRSARRLGLESTLRARGRPIKQPSKGSREEYLDLSGLRAPSGDVQDWVNLLPLIWQAGIAADFLGTPEFRADLFEGHYDALLHLPSDPSGLHNWVFSGEDMSTVRIGFESTGEFYLDG
jgi:hypothetical protein